MKLSFYKDHIFEGKVSFNGVVYPTIIELTKDSKLNIFMPNSELLNVREFPEYLEGKLDKDWKVRIDQIHQISSAQGMTVNRH